MTIYGRAERGYAMTVKTVSVGDFVIFLLLTTVTFGIYAAWWQFSRLERIYRRLELD